ncbi:MAG TPA: hypothetical protein VEH31_44945 [Streptosporangiaceae bacterium]|nr:hypothetical protein [Streptosporangiaceae bacterium]
MSDTAGQREHAQSAVRRADLGSWSVVLIDLPAGMLAWVAKRITNRSGIEKPGSPGRT